MQEPMTVVCPYCKRKIQLTEAISEQFKESLRNEIEQRYAEKAESEIERMRKEFDKQFAKKEKLLERRTKESERQLKIKEKQLLERVKKEKEKALQEARKKVEIELQDLRGRVREAEEDAERAKQKELNIRKRERELKRKMKDIELEVARKVDEEKEKIRTEAIRHIQDEYKMKEREWKEQRDGMKKQIEELKRKVEQGSQQLQGEVLELELENILRANFPEDQIEPVPKGMRGADILQRVCQAGRFYGTIVWESKRTKRWQKRWIERLKDNQRRVKGDLAVLLTTSLPKEIGSSGFALIDNVWVTDYSSAISLTVVLRAQIIEVAKARQSAVGKGKKKEILYDYLTGPEFAQAMRAIAESIQSMFEDLNREKMAMRKIWAKREKQIRKIVNNAVEMYGAMQGIIGASLPQIEEFELKALPAAGE